SQKKGAALGFRPAAVVLHHRRNSVVAYWKQQQGYGRAEALLERKWPEKYNPAGHLTWAGRLYGRGLTEALTWRRGRIYHGTWGRAPFQSLYQPAVGLLGGLSLMPEWYLLIVALGGLSGLGMLWTPLFWAMPLLALAVAAPVVQALTSAARASSAAALAIPWRPSDVAHSSPPPASAVRSSVRAFAPRPHSLASARSRRFGVPPASTLYR